MIYFHFALGKSESSSAGSNLDHMFRCCSFLTFCTMIRTDERGGNRLWKMFPASKVSGPQCMTLRGSGRGMGKFKSRRASQRCHARFSSLPPGVRKERPSQERKPKRNNDSTFTRPSNVFAKADTTTSSSTKKSRKLIYREIIAKSKAGRAERKKAKVFVHFRPQNSSCFRPLPLAAMIIRNFLQVGVRRFLRA